MSTATLPAALSEILPEILDEARRRHSQGHLLPAAQAYRIALESDPRSQPALLGLSLIARQSNQLQPALHMAQAALAAGPQSAIAWANYGDLLLAIHQVCPAQAAFRRALALDRAIAVAHYGLANTFALQDDFSSALPIFLTAVQLAPSIPEFHFALAFAHGKLGQHVETISAYRRAATLRPGFASAWLNLGVELIADGRDQLAELCYRQALESSSDNLHTQISAHLNLGHLARGRHQFPQAREQYDHALALAPPGHPRHGEVQVAFTYLHLEQQQFLPAWQSLSAAEAADSDQRNAEIPNARGILLLAEHSANPEIGVPHISALRCGIRDPLHAAIDSFQQAESLGHKTAASNRGNALLRLGHCEEAMAAHKTAVDPSRGGDPHHPGARYNLALTQLRLGDFARGWPNYEIRWSFRDVHPHPRRFHQPRWHGEALAVPSTLLIYAEQGYGDTLQFCRYLPLVARRLPDTPLILEVQPPLTRLLSGIAPRLISHGDPLPHFTHHCPLMSLPAVFGTTLETVLCESPYLRADPELARLRSRELTANLPTIGIAWAGNPNYRADRERSTSLQTLLPLLIIPKIQWISLQKGDAACQLSEIKEMLGPGCILVDGCSGDRDFADTAALISNLDLVLTTDTAVAHLAGALGKPLWLLLPWQSDWRWLQSIPTTPWYPTARLFRQSSPNDWPGLIDRVRRELTDWLTAKCPPTPTSL